VYIANAANPNVKDLDSCKKCRSKKDCFEACQYRTAITFNKGGQWYNLVAPEKDMYGRSIKCKNPISGTGGKKVCPLQLHSVLSETTHIHSHKDAIGLILGTGNVGSQLNENESDVNTYMSRDGGVTWAEVGKGSHSYEFTNRGEMIIMANNKEPTNFISYSLDYGKNFTKVQLTNKHEEDVLVERIHHPKDPSSRALVVEGTRNGDSVMYFVDMDKLNVPECKLHQNPSDPQSDYEIFLPHTYGDDRCLMVEK